jgi:hypothetical protein
MAELEHGHDAHVSTDRREDLGLRRLDNVLFESCPDGRHYFGVDRRNCIRLCGSHQREKQQCAADSKSEVLNGSIVEELPTAKSKK